MDLSIRKLDARAQIPTYGTEGAAGADLYALLDAPITVSPGETVMVHTGIAMELPEGYAGLIYPRSGMASKKGLAPANKVGVIDPDYRGEVMIALHNHGKVAQTVENGERVAQLVVTPFLHMNFVVTDALSETERRDGGFGSTGMVGTPEEKAAPEPEEETSVSTPVELPQETMDIPLEESPKEADPVPPPSAKVTVQDALTYYHGMGAPFDRKRAVELLRLAASCGDVVASARMAYLTCVGDEIAGIRPDPSRGSIELGSYLPALKTLTRTGDTEAMLMMGNAMAEGLGIHKNTRRAFEYFYTAAEKGYAPAANAMGQCYSAGVGVQPDVVRAVACFRRGAEAGFAPAQFNLGISYFNGRGIRQDKVEAAKWYALAAEQGYAPAQFLLGKHYSQIMNGVQNDPQKGLEWLTKSAEQGYMKAIIYLADIYHHAGNLEGDRRAAKWYSAAAKRGDAYALYQLSLYAAVGRGGIEKNPASSKTLLQKAKELGHKEAARKWQTLYGSEDNE